jgi:hypothetical protein
MKTKEKVKQVKKIICLLVSALVMSCSQVNVPITQDTKSTDKPTPTQSVVVSNQVKNDTKVVSEVKPEIKVSVTPTPIQTLDPTNYNSSAIDKNVIPTPSPSINPITNPTVIPTSQPSPVKSGYSVLIPAVMPSPEIKKDPYIDAKPIPGFYNGWLFLIFKDDYRIRYDVTKKEFYSLAGYDIKSINQLLISDNIRISPSNSVWTEEKMNEFEKMSQQYYSYDYPHEGSIYTLEIKDNLLNELGEKLKSTNYVRYIEFFDNYAVSND